MTDPETPPAPPAPDPAPAPKSRSGALLLVLLLVLGAAGYGSWFLYERAKGTLDAVSAQQKLLVRLEQDVSGLRARQSDLSSAASTLEERVEAGESRIAGIADRVDGGRARVQLAAVEQLLLLANDRLLLAGDAEAALTALDMADRRLASLADPRLHSVREAIASERTALSSISEADISGAALKLGEITRQAAQLPLRTRVPDEFEVQTAPQPPAGSADWTQRAWSAVRTAVASMFSLRREEGGVKRLLPPEQEALVVQILKLKLEGARLALLARDSAAFHDLVGAARTWLADYYNAGDPAVRAAQDTLDGLATLQLNPPLPDISRSLTLLRAQLQSESQ